MTGSSTSHVRWFLVFWLFVLSAVAFLDRVNISIAGSSIASEYHLSNVELGWVFSSFLCRIRSVPDPRREAGRPVWTTPGSCRWSGLVGCIHGANRRGSPRHRRRAALVCIHSVLVRRWRGGGLSCLQSIRIPLDTHSGTWHREWLDLRRSRRRRRPVSAFDYLHHAALWLEGIVLVLRRIGLVVGLVWFISARDTPAEHSGSRFPNWP